MKLSVCLIKRNTTKMYVGEAAVVPRIHIEKFGFGVNTCDVFRNSQVRLIARTLLLLPLALQPIVGFGVSNNVLPFFPICHQLSPSSHSQHLKISFYFRFPFFPGYSSPSSRPFQFLSEDFLGILSSSILSR